MASEVQKAYQLAEDNRKGSIESIGETVNPSNLNFSIAQIQSVYPDRSTCDIIIVSNGQFRSLIPSVIPIGILNITGHLSTDDYVLISHKGNGRECRIIQKLQDINLAISDDEAFKKYSGGINFGAMKT